MTAETAYSTQLLSPRTWADFETLFTGRGNGWNFCWCMAFQRPSPLPSSRYPTRADRCAANRADKERLVRAGRAHGVIVRAGGEPVGWCQFGPPDELPVMDNPRSRFAKPAGTDVPREDWRITCFVVAKPHRRRGVATVALGAALEAIRDSGGGIVEAYPLDPATEGGWTAGTRADYGHFGTVPMFEREGFERVGWLRPSNAIMRRLVRAADVRAPRRTVPP